jgi:NADH-quinone oxidoreductase subunit M
MLKAIDAYLLTVIIFLPIAGAFGLLFIPAKSDRGKAALRWGAFGIALADLLVSLYVTARFSLDPNAPAFQFLFQADWIPAWGASYQVGVDGLSLVLILLTNLLSTLAILSSFTAIRRREREYYVFMLLLQAGVLGTFLALDLFLFYIFWELMLIPLYFLIGIWGSENRVYATMKFIVYTLSGSLLMLIGILVTYFRAAEINGGVGTFDYLVIRQMDLGLAHSKQMWLFLAFLIAFAIKVPIFPLHTWLPDAHTEAPTAGSVILAGVLLKTGVYGIVRYCIPLFPEAAVRAAPALVWLAIIAVIYGAIAALAQQDMKRLVAYSSVSHMGIVILGIFVFQEQAVRGGLLQVVNHGISTGGLFLCVGMIYERRHTRLMSEFGGLAVNLRRCAALTVLIVLSSLALPGLNGFVGEILVLFGVFKVRILWAALAGLGMILSAIYLLVMVQRTFFGPLDKPANRDLRDLNVREVLTLLPLILIAFWIGLYPKPFLWLLERNSNELIAQIQNAGKPRPSVMVYHPSPNPPFAASSVSPSAIAGLFVCPLENARQ